MQKLDPQFAQAINGRQYSAYAVMMRNAANNGFAYTALGSAAFAATSAFDASGAAATAQGNAETYSANALAAYTGSTNITTLGTVGTGTWAATAVAIAHGGTGQTTANAALNALLPSQASANGQFLTSNGTSVSWASVSSPSGANPSVSVGLSAVNGSATTFLRSDGAPALSQAIAPTWTGQHMFAQGTTIFGAGNLTASPVAGTIAGASGSGSNIAGANLTVIAGLGTGTGTPGSLVFQTGAVGSSGSTLQTAVTALTLDGSQNATFAGIVFAPTVESAEYNNGNSGTTYAIAWNNGNFQKVTITGVCTFTFTAPSNPGRFQIKLVQDGTGHAITLPTIKYPGGVAPTYSSSANAIDILTVYYDGTTYYGVANTAFA